MDFIQLHKIHAINKSKKHQLLDNFFLYSMTVITCTFFCSSPFWFPSLLSSIKLLIFVSLPKISSFLLNHKFIFIVGNLIVIVLIGDSKFFASNSRPGPSDVYYNEYVNRKRDLQSSTMGENKDGKAEILIKENVIKSSEAIKMEVKVWDEEKLEVEKQRVDLHGEDEPNLPTDELNRRADDFIARVNRRRRQEARLLLC